jgi:hypothetical protein
MREVNFSIPSANKASVNITTALYDRRALDTTSVLPLINSLNNLAYLTTSSGRIRDILTVDGGIERLVCILKEGRNTKDLMDGWKWNLAFQCVVNIGVRGSEMVRTRVVEADMVPVIATLLDNYIRVLDRCRERAEQDIKRSNRMGSRHSASRSNDLSSLISFSPSNGNPHHHHLHHGHTHGLDRIRRQAPPPIDVAASHADSTSHSDRSQAAPTHQHSISSPPERTTFGPQAHRHRHQPSFEAGNRSGSPARAASRTSIPAPLPTSIPLVDAPDTFGIRPVRDIDRLPSMVPGLQAEFASLESPTTPNAPAIPSHGRRTSPARTTRRPSIRHQLSVSSAADIIPVDEPVDGPANLDSEASNALDNDIAMQDLDGDPLAEGGSPVHLEAQEPEQSTVDTLNMARNALESSTNNAGNEQLPQSPLQTLGLANPPSQTQLNPYIQYVQQRSQVAGNVPSMPRDEDVLMCLQLLAYVSKYCNLRTYFQQTHLVPKLKTPKSELNLIDGDASSSMAIDEEELIEEYLQPDDFNIFPLVEKFTVRHHTPDMQYWARVVMRNLCRKDDSRGGIRQCAYYRCGKWEEYTRQFAKCRRCRRTKYCSKECQKSAWVYHRHWCVEAQP